MKRLRRLVKASDSVPGADSDRPSASPDEEGASRDRADAASDGGAQRSSATSDADAALQVQYGAQAELGGDIGEGLGQYSACTPPRAAYVQGYDP